MSIIRPHHPPANTFVSQKLAATLPNSVIKRISTAINSTTAMNFKKHRGHISRNNFSFCRAIAHTKLCTKNCSKYIEQLKTAVMFLSENKMLRFYAFDGNYLLSIFFLTLSFLQIIFFQHRQCTYIKRKTIFVYSSIKEYLKAQVNI